MKAITLTTFNKHTKFPNPAINIVVSNLIQDQQTLVCFMLYLHSYDTIKMYNMFEKKDDE